MDIQVIGPDGRLRTPVCDGDGKLVVTGIAGGGGGGAGDASAANQATQIAQIGEVQSSPTANTVLDRLKTLAALIGEVQSNPTSNTLLDRVKGIATLLSGGLPAALGSNGGLKTEALGVTAVSGSANAGSAPTAPPLSISGIDPGGLKRHLATDTGGKLLQKPGGQTALGYQQVTSLSSAAALTVPANSVAALIQAETKDVRWRDDGTDPTASVGMVIPAGASVFFTGSLSAFRVIETDASAKLNVSYYG